MDDDRLAEKLEAYLEAIHEQRDQDAVALRRQHPEIARLADCLDGLDRLGDSYPSLQETTPPDDCLGKPHSPHGSQPDSPLGFGKYELLEEIGRGGMGVVFKARHLELQRVVAVKMLLFGQLSTPDQIERFHAEARAAARLSHPSIVPIFDVGQENGQHYFAMEYVEGESLAERLRRGRLEPMEAARLTTRIAVSVDYLHQQGVIHRDLKPSNVLFDTADFPKLTDFGLAKVFTEDTSRTRSGAIAGTPAYMAPEQAAGRSRNVTPSSDVYSLGVMLYEMLTGRTPFQADNALDLLVDVVESDPVSPRHYRRDLPRALEWICLKCLAKDPGERYRSAAELAEDLRRFQAEESVNAQPAGRFERLVRWMRQEPGLTVRIGVVIFTALVQWRHWLSGEPFSLTGQLIVFVALILLLLGRSLVLRVHFRWGLSRAAPYVAAGLDALLVTCVLLNLGGDAGPLLVAYPLMIVGSGLWFRRSVVWWTTGLTIASYLVVAWLRPIGLDRSEYHFLFIVGLLMMGFVLVYQVRRVRLLGSHLDQLRAAED
ncbi:Serine/threonine-protein kinase PrkC [Planctomycetes bacterium Pan216]|uniref:non-specific serine/threonine protein kinase n=1 Tax=Kolteria novifilia TaxID=2527975 RepID=A0A518AWZ0_9BACT|nr:Serine/threonine-protein kinase PrkC [Planctomycetes bacterium Pan216]